MKEKKEEFLNTSFLYPEKKPTVVISRCLNFENTRYNGGIIKDEFVLKLIRFVKYITVCPEVDIGLSVPREPINIFNYGEDFRLIQEKTNLDLTEKMNIFCEKFLNSLNNIDGFLLKSKSPSCGVSGTVIYYEKDGKKSGYRGKGFFAMRVKEKFPYLPVEDEARLKNPDIKFHFLVRIFSFFELNETLKNMISIKQLLDFHQNYKYLLMAYNQKILRFLGNFLANYDNSKNIGEIKENYRVNFYKAFSKKMNPKSNINVIQHIYGHFKNRLNQKEKRHFLDLLGRYKKNEIPLILLIEILKNFAYRFENEYLIKQKYLNPFPSDLF
ncbi:MAG TPA: DUF523 and DUF1722 domain-containing protein [bacterium]|nr:DUF523 and DUF1722 domain-containing protein [bacterium]HOM27524.1 DUF523 and DUF1722 domain-containing protein [bacterium]